MNIPPDSAHNPGNQFRKNPEYELEESRQLLKKLEEIAGIGHWEIDLITGQNKWSEQFFHILGLDPGTSPSTELGISTIHPEDRERASAAYQKSFELGTPYRVEKRIIRPTGEIRFVISEGIVDLNSDGNPIRLFGVFKDVTKEKLKDLELQTSHLEIENILNTSQDLIILSDDKGIFQKASKSSMKILGYSSEEMIGKPYWDFIHPDDLQTTQKSGRKVFSDNETHEFTNRYIKKDGSIIHLNWSSTLDPTTKTIFAVGRDITQLLKNKEELRADRLKLSLLLNSSPDAIWALDHEYNLITANQSFLRFLEKTGNWKVKIGDSLLSEKYFEADYIQYWKSLYDRAFCGETVIFIEKQNYENHHGYLEIEIKPIYKGEKIQSLACYAKDITQRKEEELKIAELVQKLSLAQKIGKIGYWEFDSSTNEIFWSEEIYRIWNVENSFVPDFYYFIQSIHPDEREYCLQENIQAIKEKKPLDYTHRIVLPNGDVKYLHEKGTPLLNEDGTLRKFQGTVQDITNEKKIEKELIDRTKFIESILENISLGIAVNQISTGKATYINPAFIQIYGWPQEILKDVNTFFEKIYPNPEFREYIARVIMEDIQSGDSEKMSWKDIPITTQSGEQRIISAKNIALPEQDLMISTVINETDRFWAEQFLKRSNERFHLATQAVSDAIWDWDIPNNSIFWGSGYARLFGYPAEMENISDDFWAEKIHPEDFTSIWNSILMARQNPSIDKWAGEYRFQRFDGTYAFVKENTVIIRDDQGIPVRMVGALQDITEENKAKTALLKKTSLIEATATIVQSLLEINDWQLLLTGSLKLMGETVDADRTYYFKNYQDPVTGRLYSKQIREWTNGKVSSEFENPANQTIYLDDHIDFLKSVYQKKPFSIITSETSGATRAILEDQNIKSILQIPLFVKQQFYGFIGFDDCTKNRIWSEDEKNFLKSITTNLSFAIERKQNLDKIQETLASRNSILESIGDSFYAVDQDLTVTYWNKNAELKTGIKRELIIGKNLDEYLSRFGDDDYSNFLLKAFSDQVLVHFESYDDQLNTWNDVTIYPSQKGLSVFVRDITEQKQAEKQIAETNERLAIISEATNDAIWDWNIETGEHYWGDGFRKLFGIDFEIEGNSPNYWQKRVHPDDYQLVQDNLNNLLISEENIYFEIEYRFLKADGSYAFVLDKGSVIRDKNGKPIRLVGAMQDISDRKIYEASLKTLNEDLANSNLDLEISNKELEQFAYVASHDLQEPLRMITSFLGLIEKKYNDVLDDKGRQYIYHAVDGARRMRQIILDLLEFSRVGNISEPKKWVESRSLVEEVILFNQKIIKEKNAFIYLGKLPDIFCHSSPIVQLFQNLVSNAIKYQKPDTIPEVIIQGKDKGNFWEFSVSDNGIGIEQEYLTKIFIIFQRLHQKEQYSGSGIGLAICKKITEIHGGKIWVESTPGKGSTFYFTIKKQ